MRIGEKIFSGYTYVMAIINLTPDSFFEGSRTDTDGVLFRAEKAVKDGAAVIDIGGQSTRPSYKEIPPERELERIENALVRLKKNIEAPISVDTYFTQVARACLALGADMINDVHGCAAEGMAEAVAEAGASMCIMHSRQMTESMDIFPLITEFLHSAAKRAERTGVSADKICVDGGIGFGKSREQNLLLLKDYAKLKAAGYPLLLGASRKSLFGGEVSDRLAPTLEATRTAARGGVLFVRVHDIKENVQAIKEVYGG